MPIFFLGLLLGALSGGGTYSLTDNGQLGALVGVACWLGVAAIVLIDD